MPFTVVLEQGSALMKRVPLLACPAVFIVRALLDEPAVAPHQEYPLIPVARNNVRLLGRRVIERGSVVPEKAGTQKRNWIPAFAGMTAFAVGIGQKFWQSL